jgi:signal transduction histidine kinase
MQNKEASPMKQADYFSMHIREYFTDETKIKADIQSQMLLRYFIVGFATVFLFVFRYELPFPFPHFFLVACASWISNMVIHVLSLKKTMLKKVYGFIPYNDALIAPFIFQCTGGFLSPFVITHVASNIGSCIVYTRNKNLALNTLFILSAGYLGVAFLQKFHILPNGIGYAQAMMDNDAFFYFVTIVTALIFTGAYFLVRALNYHVHQMLNEISHSFYSILKGTVSAVGQDFFIHLTRHLSQSLFARCAMIAELTNKGESLRSLAVWKDGKVDENFESPVEGTIFADVLARQKCGIDENTDALFQTNPLLAQCKAVFFFGEALNDSKGKPIGLLCLVNDKPMHNMYLVEPLVSIFASRAAAELERKQNEERQKSVELQLAHAHKMNAVGQLASGIAHDFNNMFGAVSGCAQLLAQKIAGDSPHQRYIKHILDASRHTSELVGQLTRFALRDKPESTLVDVNKTVEDTIEILRGTIHKKITITKNPAEGAMYIRGDAARFANVLLNLGINARDAMEECYSGTLSFSTATAVLEKAGLLCQSFSIEPGNYISIGVSDTGIGMSKETLDHIFEPFFTTKPKGKGTGLGLSNVWGYVENYKGAIEVKSEPGKGSVFTLYFPLFEAPGGPNKTLLSTTQKHDTQ